MRTAALAGVDVRLMIPYHGDAKVVEWATRSYILQAAQAGVRILLYRAAFNHSKLLISDDSLCTCGSTNIDFRSFENNFEANIFFYDEQTALRMKDIFLHDQESCVALTDVTDLENRPFYKRLGESLIRMLSPLL
jgi:cardiolipin synthase